jgi:hypothetical protein
MLLGGMPKDKLNSSDKHKILSSFTYKTYLRDTEECKQKCKNLFTYEIWSYFNEEWIKNCYYLGNFKREGKEREIILKTFHCAIKYGV